MRFTVIALLASGAAVAQERPPAEPKKPAFVPPAVRLAAAKSALVKNGGGSEIPYSVISSGMEGWGRFTLVESAPEADIVVEVTSPEEEGGVSMSSRTRTSTGRMEESTTTSRNLSSDAIRLVVYDARTRVLLWSGREQAKGGCGKRPAKTTWCRPRRGC